MAVRPLHIATGINVVVITLANVHLAVQEEIDVIGRQTRIERRRQFLTRCGRCDHVRRDDDYQIGLLLLIGRTAEQCPEHGH